MTISTAVTPDVVLIGVRFKSAEPAPLEPPNWIQTCHLSCVEQDLFPVVLGGATSRRPRGPCLIIR
jgi:hypothetical protein